MQWLNHIGFDFLLTREYLKAGKFVATLSVWVLVGLFFYLNRYTKRRYFTVWTTAWLFYALWITLGFGATGNRDHSFVLMVQQWCIGVAAMFLLWGSYAFMGRPVRQSMLGWFFAFLLIWSYFGAYHLKNKPLEMELPVFGLIAVSSIVTASSFFVYRRKHPYVGATLLAAGFTLWGLFMAVYPFLENSEELISLALFISAGLQIMLAVSMIILVLEEIRETQQAAIQQAAKRGVELDMLETRMNSSEERYRKLFDQAGEAIIITAAGDSRILELNQAAERLLGIRRGEPGRHSLTAFCHMPGSGAGAKDKGDWVASICRQRPLTLARKNGTLTPVEINGVEIEFDGKPAYQFFVVELTERAKLEQRLRQAEKLSAIGRMISGVAHELNNPLSVVKGYLELVLSHHDLSPRTRADLEKAAEESNRAAKLVKSFLSFAREQPSHRELVQLNDLVKRMVELRHYDLNVAKTDVQLELEPEMPTVSADPDQIYQLLVNLVNNALQAIMDLPQSGKLKIKTVNSGDRLQLIVEDNGPGVPPQFLEKIFEPFFTTKEVGAGTGLGLSIAHTIMNEHKGRIFYQKSSLGGAGFVLEFPLALSKAGPSGSDGTTMITAKPKVAPVSGNILVLDDEKSIAEMLAEMLGLLGYTATVSNAGAHALELIKEKDFDLVISDFRMPGLNGQQFFEQAIQKCPSLARRIIFLTGDVVNEDTLGFLTSIGNPHIAKPFSLVSVKKVVAEVIRGNAPALAGSPA